MTWGQVGWCVGVMALAWGCGEGGARDDRGAARASAGEDAWGMECVEGGGFEDPQLEAVVRHAVGRVSGCLEPTDLQGVKQLSAPQLGIESLEGIQALINLEVLNLSWNRIEDLAPLSGLRKLSSLDVSWNELDDIGSLTGLTRLATLDVSWNRINGPLLLGKHENLADLSATGSGVAELGDSLRELPSLRHADFSHNPLGNKLEQIDDGSIELLLVDDHDF